MKNIFEKESKLDVQFLAKNMMVSIGQLKKFGPHTESELFSRPNSVRKLQKTMKRRVSLVLNFLLSFVRHLYAAWISYFDRFWTILCNGCQISIQLASILKQRQTWWEMVIFKR